MLNKEKILEESRNYLAIVIQRAKDEVVEVGRNILRLKQKLRTSVSVEGKVEAVILANNQERELQLGRIVDSPYFVRCDLQLKGENGPQEFYFGKFQLSEANVYSWISPIAQVRFADIGAAQYKLPNGEIRKGELLRKDQFMIIGGQMKFMVSEAVDYERTLIYQDHLANKKSEFVLPEIIAKMEKAQDEVIRAEHKGSFLIAGPAGSGKTTLAFHRIAYLVQSPDTAKFYPSWNIVVFVQDESTKKYFSAILPQLGIEDVKVVTFEQWALEILSLTDYKFTSRFGRSEEECDLYEYCKTQALRDFKKEKFSSLNTESILFQAYQSLPYQDLLKQQLAEKVLDRFDLTILLKNLIDEDGHICLERRVVVEDWRGNLKITRRKLALAYSFVVVDEAENYLAQQISIIRACVNSNKSLLYVGDLAQQTKLSTIKNWSEVGEDFSGGRKVLLDKVYRNTKEILKYISSLGYKVDVPENLKSGNEVIERNLINGVVVSEYVQNLVASNPRQVIGVLYRSQDFKKVKDLGLAGSDILKVLSFNEAQGVEFEIVVILKFTSQENDKNNYPEVLKKEKEKVEHDLWYVALTRSMDQLHILEIK